MTITPNGTSPGMVQQALALLLDQVVKYGLATVLTLGLVGLMVYERVQVDSNQTQLLREIVSNQGKILESQSVTRQMVDAHSVRTLEALVAAHRDNEQIIRLLERRVP